jgi:hypothetical protein
MRRIGKILLPLVVAAFSASGAAAQACLGLPSFEGKSIHFTAGGEFPDSASSYTVGLGAGKSDGLFANLGVGQVTYKFADVTGKTNLGFIEFGYQLPLAGVQICPVGGGFFGVGPDDELVRITVTQRAATGGLSAGYPIAASSVTIIPNTAVKFTHLDQKVVEEDVGEATATYDSWDLDLGLALILSGRFSVQPVMHIPLSGEETDPTIGIFASVGFSLP